MSAKGQYSLSNVAASLGVSAAWVNKVQRKLGIGGVPGKHPEKSTFGDDELFMLRRVKLLRILDYSFSDIDRVYNIEKKMLSCKSVNNRYVSGAIGQGYSYVIHPFNFTYDEKSDSVDDLRQYDSEIAGYKKLCSKIYQSSIRMSERSNMLFDQLQDFNKSLLPNAEAAKALQSHKQ